MTIYNKQQTLYTATYKNIILFWRQMDLKIKF